MRVRFPSVLLLSLLQVLSAQAAAGAAPTCPRACQPSQCRGVAARSSFSVESMPDSANAHSRGSKICLSQYCGKSDGDICPGSHNDDAADDATSGNSKNHTNSTTGGVITSDCGPSSCSFLADCRNDSEYFQPTCDECLSIYPEACSPQLLKMGSNTADDERVVPQFRSALSENDKPVGADLTPAEMIARWQALGTPGGRCYAICRAKKSAMCKLLPSTCVQLRCEDVYEGIADRPKAYDSLCMVTKNWHDTLSPNGSCGPECEEARRLICYRNVRMCPSLRCGEIDNTAGTVPWSLARTCEQQLSVAEAIYSFAAESFSSEATPAVAFLRQLSDEDRDAAEPLRKLSQRGKDCGFVCMKELKDLCSKNPVLCMQLRCEEAWNSMDISDPTFLEACSAFYPFAITAAPSDDLQSEIERADGRLTFQREWQALHEDIPCAKECQASKVALCSQDPYLCLRLRCNETGIRAHGIAAMVPVCEDAELRPLPPALTLEQVDDRRDTVLEWYNQVILPASRKEPCGDECKELKLHACTRPETNRLCVTLTCYTAQKLGLYTSQLDDICPAFLEENEDLLSAVPAELTVAGKENVKANQQKDAPPAVPNRRTCPGVPFRSLTASELQNAGDDGNWPPSTCKWLCKTHHKECVASVYNPDEYFKCRLYDSCGTVVWRRPGDVFAEAPKPKSDESGA